MGARAGAQRPHFDLARQHEGSRRGGWASQRGGEDAAARRAPVVDARDHFLTDIAALLEIDAADEVHVGFVGKGLAIGEVLATFGNPASDALRLISQAGVGVARQRGALHDAADAEAGVARVGLCALRRGRIAPDRQHAHGLAQVGKVDLRAQPVEAQAFQEIGGQFAGGVEPEGVALLRDDKIGYDLALRGQKRPKGGRVRADALDVAGEQALQKAARLSSADAQKAPVP